MVPLPRDPRETSRILSRIARGQEVSYEVDGEQIHLVPRVGRDERRDSHATGEGSAAQ